MTCAPIEVLESYAATATDLVAAAAEATRWPAPTIPAPHTAIRTAENDRLTTLNADPAPHPAAWQTQALGSRPNQLGLRAHWDNAAQAGAIYTDLGRTPSQTRQRARTAWETHLDT